MNARVWRGVWFLLATLATGVAQAGDTPTDSKPGNASGTAQTAAAGLAVFAGRGAADAAWPLAQQIYARPGLRPVGLEEPQARVLAGDNPPADASTSLRELAETRDAIRGDDAPSRQLLLSIAHQLHVRGLIVVTTPAVTAPPASPAPVARVFLAESGAFDAASYQPDAPGTGAAWKWSGAVASLDRAYAVAPGTTAPGTPRAGSSAAPRGALTTAPGKVDTRQEPKPGARPFYASPWFWGAIGAAVVGGAGIFLATRDGSSDTIHLQMQVPR